jgi:hypothetical protein
VITEIVVGSCNWEAINAMGALKGVKIPGIHLLVIRDALISHVDTLIFLIHQTRLAAMKQNPF